MAVLSNEVASNKTTDQQAPVNAQRDRPVIGSNLPVTDQQRQRDGQQRHPSSAKKETTEQRDRGDRFEVGNIGDQQTAAQSENNQTDQH